jgi:hypothetical protein
MDQRRHSNRVPMALVRRSAFRGSEGCEERQCRRQPPDPCFARADYPQDQNGADLAPAHSGRRVAWNEQHISSIRTGWSGSLGTSAIRVTVC